MKYKGAIYNTYFKPTFTHAEETWTVSKKEICTIQTTKMKLLKSITGKIRRLRNSMKIGKLQNKWFSYMKQSNF
jgi:valyl-tRNA synthetase